MMGRGGVDDGTSEAMTATVTLDEVWRLFKATDERIARLNQETDERFKVTDERFKETGERIKELAERQRETSEQIKANDLLAIRRHGETEAALRELSRRMGQFTNQVGEFAEELVVPAARRLFAARGIPVHFVARRVQGERNGRAAEIDILVVNADHAVAIEVKTRPRIAHVDEHLERLAVFKEIFPKYSDCKLLGAIAGILFDENVSRYAYQRGLFVLGQSGDVVTILNDDKFQPKVW
jgi:Holliday junction resolvase